MGKALGVGALICSLSGILISYMFYLVFYLQPSYGMGEGPTQQQMIIIYIAYPIPFIAIICGAIQIKKDVPGYRSKTAIAGIVIGTGAIFFHVYLHLVIIPA